MRRDWEWQSQRWRQYRRHRPPSLFMWRIGCAFAATVAVGIVGATAVVSLFFLAPRQALAIIAAAAIVLVVVATSFATVFRRVTRSFRDQYRLRRQLMADVPHELPTPIPILQGRIEGMIDGVYPRDEAHLRQLLDQTRHLSRLVEDVGTIANAEAGALELRTESIDPANIIRDAASSFDRPIAVVIPQPLPRINADPVRIREVLLNLLSNAVRHTPPDGTITMHATTHGNQLEMRVVDTGVGIPVDRLPRIFDRLKTPEFAASRLYILSELPARLNTPEFFEALKENVTREPWYPALSTLEEVGVFIHFGYLEGPPYYYTYGSNILSLWPTLKRLIELHRIARDNPYAWKDTEEMVNDLSRYAVKFVEENPRVQPSTGKVITAEMLLEPPPAKS